VSDSSVVESEVVGFIEELNHTFPRLGLSLGDVTLVHRGLVPGRVTRDGHVALKRDEFVRDHASEGLDGLISIAGSKYTTARAAAERLVDRLVAKLRHPATRSRTAVTRLPSIGRGDLITAVRSEMAMTLADAVIRRTPLGATGFPGDAELERAARVIASELHWSDDRTRSEIETVRRFYRFAPTSELG
jgi:glycerol-3-phosphate dehydrogenase